MAASIQPQDHSQSIVTPRVPLKRTLFTNHWDLHKKVEDSPLVVNIREKKITKIAYFQYLINLNHDLSIIEPAIKGIKSVDLSSFCLLENLNRDIDALSLSDRQISPLLDQFKHREHLEKLAKEDPSLLVAHSVIQYLGIVFGGQKQIERLKDANLPTHLNELSGKVEAVRASAFTLIEKFDETLDDAAYHRFVDELKNAWEFAGDILDNNIRDT